MADYVIETVVSAPFEENSYIVWRKGSDEAIVVDPGFDPESILETTAGHRLRVVAILNTHGHSDHIAGNRAIKAAFPDAPLVIGRNEAHMLTEPNANLSAVYGLAMTSPAADRLVDDEERIDYAGISFRVREIPGHSPGSVVYIADGFDPAFVLGGDVLFAGSVGRADFPGGDGRRLISGIRSKLFSLPDETLVLSGHGPVTTIGAERRSNPFVGEDARAFRLG